MKYDRPTNPRDRASVHCACAACALMHMEVFCALTVGTVVRGLLGLDDAITKLS
jgi:hypothetical protein